MAESESIKSIQAYQLIRSLVGQWQEVNNTTTVDFRESASGSIIIETWYWPEKPIEALTIYFLDGQQLTATHYCPLGNQPTLRLTPGDNDNHLNFHIVSITNLADNSQDHCQSFWFEFVDENSFVRSESYWDNGVLDTKQMTYQRVLSTK